MTSNALGRFFRMTTFGESHGAGIGVVVDGCPAGVPVDLSRINQDLARRAPGKTAFTSPRKETDTVEILSGVYQNQTTGAPVCLWIKNQDAQPSQYESIQHLMRPGHANYSYLKKYGIFDHRGGGRASARETAARVAAASLAMPLLENQGIEVTAYLQQAGTLACAYPLTELTWQTVVDDPIFCPERECSLEIQKLLTKHKQQGDSVGGVVVFVARGIPAGLGDPMYAKVTSCLAQAMMSVPAAKGFEIGEGFAAATLCGSSHNDAFQPGDMPLQTNHAGGILGGITTGLPLYGRVAFKPTASIQKPQQTIDTAGNPQVFQLPSTARHDPCVAIRAVPVVRAMLVLTLVDLLLANRLSRWDF
jgi:chorismate synthase